MSRSRMVVLMVWSPRYLPQSCTTRFEATTMLLRSGEERRHHLYEKRLQRALKKAVAAGGTASPLDALMAGFAAVGREWREPVPAYA